MAVQKVMRESLPGEGVFACETRFPRRISDYTLQRSHCPSAVRSALAWPCQAGGVAEAHGLMWRVLLPASAPAGGNQAELAQQLAQPPLTEAEVRGLVQS